MIFNNKRGISPLVATILLISFAVSIGALIMNWTSSETNPISAKASCSNVQIRIVDACLEENHTVLSIMNNGEADIDSIILRTNGRRSYNYVIPSSKLALTENKIYKISKEVFNSTDFKIVPAITSGEDELVCSSQSIDGVSLDEC